MRLPSSRGLFVSTRKLRPMPSISSMTRNGSPSVVMPYSKVCTMFLWRSADADPPSLGFSAPRKRASNLAVFSLSSNFRQTVRPRLLSRARHTLDMLPWPVRLSSSKRLRTSITANALGLGIEPR